jgi:hypothetical protein
MAWDEGHSTPTDLTELLELALAAPRERLRLDAEAAPAFGAFFDAVGESLRDAIDAIYLHSFLDEAHGEGERPKEADVRRYAEGFQVEALEHLVQLTAGQRPSAEMAKLFGITTYFTLCKVYERCAGERPVLVRFERLESAFDPVGWCRFVNRAMMPAEVRGLAASLGERFPDAFATPPEPVPLDLSGEWTAPQAKARTLADGMARRDALAEEIAKRIRAAAASCDHAGAYRVLCHVADNLFDTINFTDDLPKLRVTDNSVGMTVKFFLGNSPTQVQERGQMEIAAALFNDGGYSVKALAEILVLRRDTFRRRFERHIGISPGEAFKVHKATAGHPFYALWNSPELDDAGARKLAGVLAARYPDSGPAPRPRRVLLRNVQRVPDLLAAFEALPPSNAFAPAESALSIDWPRVAKKAISLDQRKSEGRRDSEQTLAVSEHAPLLYLLRRGQAALAVQEALPRLPAEDPHVRWLRTRREDDDTWRAADEDLPPAPAAAEELAKADGLRQELLARPEYEREALIAAPESPYLNVVVATVCLIAVERDHLGRRDLALAETWITATIANILLKRHGRKGGRNVLADLLVLALAWRANVYRLHGQFDLARATLGRADDVAKRYVLGSYAEARLAQVRAVFLRAEGKDPERAEQEALRAAEIFAGFDEHMASCVLIDLAEIERFRSGNGLATLEKVIQGLDEHRDRFAYDVAQSNRLYYLVEDEREAEADVLRHSTPRPRHPVNRARRAVIDACIDLALGRLDAAEMQFNDADDRLQGLDMSRDVVIVTCYLASVSHQRRDAKGVRQRLKEAADWAHAAGLQEAPLVVQLIAALDDGVNVVDAVHKVARQLGGCLGPRGPRRTRDQPRGLPTGPRPA